MRPNWHSPASHSAPARGHPPQPIPPGGAHLIARHNPNSHAHHQRHQRTSAARVAAAARAAAGWRRRAPQRPTPLAIDGASASGTGGGQGAARWRAAWSSTRGCNSECALRSSSSSSSSSSRARWRRGHGAATCRRSARERHPQRALGRAGRPPGPADKAVQYAPAAASAREALTRGRQSDRLAAAPASGT
jgi:hypothetical protein